MMSNIQPFLINVDDTALEDLKARLALTRFPDKETPDDWSQGIPLAYMQEIRDYWQNEYDWKSREALLNQWPGFKSNIQGLDIHFLHITSSSLLA